MEKLSWKEEYSVGIFEIDAEHKIFLKTIKKIDLAINSHLDIEILKRLLDELYKYADFHFTSEENVMLMNDYPQYESHKAEHLELISTLSNMISFWDMESINKNELIEFLVRWFKKHTASTDLDLGKFLVKNNSHFLTWV